MLKVNNSQEQEYDLVIIIGPDNPGDKSFEDLNAKLVEYARQLQDKKILIISNKEEEITPEFIKIQLKDVKATNAIFISHGLAERESKGQYGRYSMQDSIEKLAEQISGSIHVIGCHSGTLTGPTVEDTAVRIISYSSRKNASPLSILDNVLAITRFSLEGDKKGLLEELLRHPETMYIFTNRYISSCVSGNLDTCHKLTAPKFEEIKSGNIDEIVRDHLKKRRKELEEIFDSKEEESDSNAREIDDDTVKRFIAKCLHQFSLRGGEKNLYKISFILESAIGKEIINEADNLGWNALHLAAENGHLEIVTTLIKKEADINNANKQEVTALHLAAANGHLDIVEKLVEKKANKDEIDNQGWTALHFAAANGHLDIVTTLIEKEANKDATNNQQMTALHLAAANGHTKTVTTLIKKEADINRANNKGWTALHLAAAKGHKDIVTTLIEEGADINNANEEEVTALHLAAANGHLDIVTTLIEKGADINKANNQGLTALHLAAANNPEMVAVLSPNPNPTPGMISYFARCFKSASGGSNSQVTTDDSADQRLDPVAPTR